MRHDRGLVPLHIPFLAPRPLISLPVSSRHHPTHSILLDRIIELEQQVPKNAQRTEEDVIQARSSVFPRALLPKKAQDYFRANMRVALEESSSEDPKVDPIYYSRHVGPQARKQQEEEMTHRAEEEAREARRQTKRARTTKGKEIVPQGQVFPIIHPPDMTQAEAGTSPIRANTHLAMAPY